MQVDVGFGDAITPEPERIAFPTLLNGPQPTLLAYPPYTAIAEKFQPMVALDMANSRMKDFYDILVIFRSFSLEAKILAQAIQRTFERRAMPLPTQIPTALTPEFSSDAQKQMQWKAFTSKSRLTEPMGDLSSVIAELNQHLRPTLHLIGIDLNSISRKAPMPINPIRYTEKVVKNFLRYQVTTYPFSDPGLNAQMKSLL